MNPDETKMTSKQWASQQRKIEQTDRCRFCDRPRVNATMCEYHREQHNARRRKH
jgi:hypothetical protein